MKRVLQDASDLVLILLDTGAYGEDTSHVWSHIDTTRIQFALAAEDTKRGHHPNDRSRVFGPVTKVAGVFGKIFVPAQNRRTKRVCCGFDTRTREFLGRAL